VINVIADGGVENAEHAKDGTFVRHPDVPGADVPRRFGRKGRA
jgi:hypothetical protein